MGLGEFWLQSGNAKKISLNNIKELNKSELEGNKNLITLFNVFNTNGDEKLDKAELTSLFNTIQAAATSSTGKHTSIFEIEEAKDFINTKKLSDGKTTLNEFGVQTADLFNFLSKLAKTEGFPSTAPASKYIAKTDEEVQKDVIQSLRADSDTTLRIISNMNIGNVSEWYDSIKTYFNSDTSKAKVLEAAVNEAQGAKYMEKAKAGKLTRGEYIKANKQRLKEMMKARLYKKDKNDVDYIDKHRAELKMSRKDFEELMLSTIERMTEDMDFQTVKAKMRQFPMTTEKGDEYLMDSIKQNAIILYGKAKIAGCLTLDTATKYISDKTVIVNSSKDDDKLMTFEDVFYYEQGINYSKENCEEYLNYKTKFAKKLESYNKHQEFKTGVDSIKKEKDAERALNKLVDLFESFYSTSLVPNLAYNNLKSIIKSNNLPISITQDENGKIFLSMAACSDSLLLSYVSDILESEEKIQQQRLNKIFGGNAEEVLTKLQAKVETSHEKAYGNDFSSALGKAMMEDNNTVIQRYTSGASMIGMGLTLVGGILCFTPAAALGAGMITAGNTAAVSGMMAGTVLGAYEAATREHGAKEGEYEEIIKDLMMNIAGFAAGGVAGKVGMKAFNKVIDKELVDVFKQSIVHGDRAEVLKQILTNRKFLQNLAQATGEKFACDFVISLSADLIMMGVLDTDDDVLSLIQSNVIGIIVGMSGDIKEAAMINKKLARYRILKKNERANKLSPEEIKELALLHQDADIQKLCTSEEAKSGINDFSLSTKDMVKKYKELVPDIKPKELNKILNYIDMLKHDKNLNDNDIISGKSNIDYKFVNSVGEKIRKNNDVVSFADYKKTISEGKSIIEMTDEELESYYKKLVPFINDKELQYLKLQTIRVKYGEPKYLNTPEENEIFGSIRAKEKCGLPLLKGICVDDEDIAFAGLPIEQNNQQSKNINIGSSISELNTHHFLKHKHNGVLTKGEGGFSAIENGDLTVVPEFLSHDKNKPQITAGVEFPNHDKNKAQLTAGTEHPSHGKKKGQITAGAELPNREKQGGQVTAVPELKNEQKVEDKQKSGEDKSLIPDRRKLVDGKYNKQLMPYDKVGNKVFAVRTKDLVENPAKITEIKKDIESIRKTEPQKADELQIILDMYTNPTEVKLVNDKQINAVVNYLNEHYGILEDYFTIQAHEIGLDKHGRFAHRMKSVSSTTDKIVNYIKDAVKEEEKFKQEGKDYTPKTLLDAFNDIRDKYACRTVFEEGDYTTHYEVAPIIKEANALKAQGRIEEAKIKMHEAELRAAEIQSEPILNQLLVAMSKAKNENSDLSMMRISNYASENGIPIFSPRQMRELKYEAAKMGVDVTFIKLATDIDPKAETEFVKGASTKQQPSGYTALQINFVTKTGEIMEWQCRGKLVDRFAEAEHLPYDLRTGKNPWTQNPELEPLFKPIADLLDKDVMPKHAYAQVNKYFVDYYAHLRRLELGFESTEPRLEDYEHYNYTDDKGITTQQYYKFDKRLKAQNLELLHNLKEVIESGGMTPEAALKKYNMALGLAVI